MLVSITTLLEHSSFSKVESRDFSQAEKERTACKAEQIQKMTTSFTQNDNLGPF